MRLCLMRVYLRLPALLVAFAAVASLGGCSSGDDSGDARSRLLNVSSGYQSLDLYVTEDDSDTDSLQASAITFAGLSSYNSVESGTYDIKFKRAGLSSTLLTLSDKKLADDSNVTYVAYGAVGRFGVLEIGEDVEEPDDNGRTKLQAVNVSEAGTLDIYLTQGDVPLEDASPLFGGLTAAGGMQTTDRGDYRLRVTGANDIKDLRLDIPSITLDNKKVATLILSETRSGMLVDALLLPQQGSLTQFVNTKARVRAAVGLSSGAMASLRVGGTNIINGQGRGVISAYSQVEAGNVAVTLLVDGAQVPVDNQTLVAGGDYTVLLWNDTAGTHASLISDDNHVPTTANDTKIRLLNGLSSQGVPLTLYVNFFPYAEGTPLGAASTYSEVDSGTDYQVDVYNAVSATALLSREADLQSSSVYTLLVFGKADGTVDSTLRKDR
jgi:hypothetical protein